MNESELGSRRLPTLRARLLWIVNLCLGIAFSVILVFDYQRELTEQLVEEHGSLESDASIHHEAITRLRAHGMEYVQAYVDAIGRRPLDSYARRHNHYLLVCVHQKRLLAPQGQPQAQDLFAAMEQADRAPGHRGYFGEEELIVASHTAGDLSVYVADYVTNLRWWILKDMLWRLGGILALGLLGVVVLNILLLRLIARPLDLLVGTVQEIGKGHLGARAEPIGTSELNQLAGAINQMSQSLEEVENQRRQEMDKARRIQAHLLPGAVAIPGLTVRTLYLPATEVAGDYFDVLRLGDGSWVLCIADVTGHGVPAAMTAAMLKALLLQAVERITDPAEILEFVNRRFGAVALPEDFASAILVRWDAANATCAYASAGHEPAWLVTAEAVLELPSTGMLLGPSDDLIWEAVPIPVASGQRLYLFTDGYTEAPVPGKGLFGRKHLRSLLGECQRLPLDEVIPRLTTALDQHLGGYARPDDLTIMVIEFQDKLGQ